MAYRHNAIVDKDFSALCLLLDYGANIYSENVPCLTVKGSKLLSIIDCTMYNIKHSPSAGTHKRLQALLEFLDKQKNN